MLGIGATKHIKRNILISLGLMVALELFLGTVSGYNLVQLSDSTKNLYEHPYTVISSTKTIQSNLASMSRSMKDVLLSKCEEDIQSALREIEISETIILKEFDVISDRFLGDKEQVKAFYNSFIDSKATREKVLLLKKSGKLDQAAAVMKSESHYNRLNEMAFSLIDFAQNKADHYLKYSISTKYIALYTVMFIVAIILFLLTIATGFLLKSIERVDRNQKRLQKTFIIQSRMAQMGELLSMIAHQWKQPLSAISAINTHFKVKLSLGDYDFSKKEDYDDFTKGIMDDTNDIEEHIHNMVVTLDDFRNFYKPNKKSSVISVNQPINKALEIIGPSLSTNNIEIVKNYHTEEKFNVYENELIQVVLNIIKNAQDNLIENNIEDPKITITTTLDEDEMKMKICDNGGGISNDIIGKVFNAYFSTKDETIGTGLGLYMSKIIIEDHHKGSLRVKNVDDGVCFSIKIPKEASFASKN